MDHVIRLTVIDWVTVQTAELFCSSNCETPPSADQNAIVFLQLICITNKKFMFNIAIY